MPPNPSPASLLNRAATAFEGKASSVVGCPVFLTFPLLTFPRETTNAMTTPDESASLEPIIQDMLAQYAKAEQERLDAMKHTLKAEILPQFRELGVANIEVSYSGYGDSGAIDGVQYRGPTGIRVDRATIPEKLIEDLESCAYEFLPAGFEINDGGQGTLTIDVQASKVTLTHETNYTASNSTTKEFPL